MASPSDYYKVLGVSRDATVEEIRRAFRRKALEFHPDRNSSPDAEMRFREINEAYQELLKLKHVDGAETGSQHTEGQTDDEARYGAREHEAQQGAREREHRANTPTRSVWLAPLAQGSLILLVVVGVGIGVSYFSRSSPPVAVPAPPPQTPTPTAIPTPTPPFHMTAAEVSELRNYALGLINQDRAEHGLAPVQLGWNIAAQLHAQDMLDHDYAGSLRTDGSKPYMVYSRTGGTSYAADNALAHGWTSREWQESGCDSPIFSCKLPGSREAISNLQRAMMDVGSTGWGYRENILDARHRFVNVGIASNGRRTAFVQYFEGGAVTAAPPVLSTGGTLSMSMTIHEPGITIFGTVPIYYDPLPTPKTPERIDGQHNYCVGSEGFPPVCGDPVAHIVDPPEEGYRYTNLRDDVVVADSWVETTSQFSFSAETGALLSQAGVYTLTLWRDTGDTTSEEQLVELSIFVP